MGGEDDYSKAAEQLEKLQEENDELQLCLEEMKLLQQQAKDEKEQIQNCYDQAVQELADSEAKREITEKELRFAHDQIASMWKEFESMRMKLDNPPLSHTNKHPPPNISDNSTNLLCILCQGKTNSNHSSPIHITAATTNHISTTNHATSNQSTPARLDALQGPQNTLREQSPQNSPKKTKKSWFSRKQASNIQDTDSHSKVCSSGSNPPSPLVSRKNNSSSSPSSKDRSKVNGSPPRGTKKGEEYLLVNVTRSTHGTTDMAPFKIITKTNLPTFLISSMEVHRSQGDFQWLYSSLQEACPERIVPPLRPPISLDATISEFQRFLSRLSTHKILSKHNFFVTFLSGSAEELRALRVKYRPHRHGDKIRYKPAMGRDTNSGPLVDTKDYLTMLEQNLIGLSSHLEQNARKGRGSPMERAAHWFRAVSDSEPHHTYLKKASADLARTCEGMEGQVGDSDEILFIQNLQSLTDYIKMAQELLTRVEESVDQYLYWDEEVSLIEEVNSSPIMENPPRLDESREDHDGILNFDDSGVSDTTSSTNSSGEGHAQSQSHVTMGSGSHDEIENGISTSERWAHASKQCADSKDNLEVMCSELAEELSFFDLQKEKEIKQILLDYASSQLERHEKFQGKWFAMKFLLDSAISVDKRAIQFSPSPSTPTSPSPLQTMPSEVTIH